MPGWQDRVKSSISDTFLRPAKPKEDGSPPDWDPTRVIPVAERREAMNGLDPLELKWAKGGFVSALLIAVLIIIVVSVQKTTEKVSKTTSTSVTPEAILIGGIVLFFAILGFIAIKRRRRTLVVFPFFIEGFACALTTNLAPVGFAYLVLGGWLMLRARRVQKFGVASGKLAAQQAATMPSRREPPGPPPPRQPSPRATRPPSRRSATPPRRRPGRKSRKPPPSRPSRRANEQASRRAAAERYRRSTTRAERRRASTSARRRTSERAVGSSPSARMTSTSVTIPITVE